MASRVQLDKVGIRIDQKAPGQATVILMGRLNSETAGKCWEELEARLRPLSGERVEIDASHLEIQGGIGLAIVRYVRDGGMTSGAAVTVHGISVASQKIMETFAIGDLREFQSHRTRRPNAAEEVGAGVRSLLVDLREQVMFVGALLRALPGAVVRPKRMRWGEVKRIMETAGANALPVVALFSWLVGLVLALEASHPLSKLGAQIFIADMIGFASIRDTGPLVTAIMLAGRSGSAFAAELGTMK
ncbi:MAG: MlaE family ABC transporter permease, partial [Limisphaerales bacterium]